MAGSYRRTSSEHPPTYNNPHNATSTDEFINIETATPKEATAYHGMASQEPSGIRPSISYLPPPFPPPAWSSEEEVRLPFLRRYRRPLRVMIYLCVLLAVTAGLTVPVVLYYDDGDWSLDDEEEKHRDLLHHLFRWLLISWCCFALSNIVINIFPHLFRFVARRVNPGHVKYWRIFRFMRLPVTLLGGTIGMYFSYFFIIFNDKAIGIPQHSKPPAKFDDEIQDLLHKVLKKMSRYPKLWHWDRILNDILSIFVVWACLYFFEKIAMLYISIHYHYRSDGHRIERSKRLRKALATLYEASTSICPKFHDPFRQEDAVIREGGKSKLRGKLRHVASSLAVVDNALESQRSAAALAKRIWISLVPEAHNVLTVNDILEVLGPKRRAEAEEAFSILDDDENGDLTLKETVLIALETANTRHSVYQGMADIDNAISSLHWIVIILINMTIVLFITARYMPALKGMKDAAGFAALGLSFGLGRSLYEFINGCIFIFFKHAYDVGDRIEVYNPTGQLRTSVVVKRISILFTIFQRLDNGKDLQMSNDRLNIKRIENVTRSGANREECSIFVDFNTSFTDIQNLKYELQAFLQSNPRDYYPGCEVRVLSIFEMNKLELWCGFTHKSNWSNEELRAARSSKFMCALVVAIRRLSLPHPGSLVAAPVQPRPYDERNEAAAYQDLTLIPAIPDRTIQERVGTATSGADINSWIGQESVGIRRRQDQVPGAGLYGR